MKTFALASTLLLCACSSEQDQAEKTPEAVALVTVARAEQGTIAGHFALYGLVVDSGADKQTLSAPADAIVREIVTPVGTRVATGTIIARLDPAPTARLDIAKAAADARVADAALARALRLRADGLVSDADVETARAAAAATRATRSSLATRSGLLIVRALTAGFVQTIPVSKGELLTSGTVVATLSGSGVVRARFGVDPSIVKAIHVGAQVHLTRVGESASLKTAITSVDPTIDPQTHLGSAYASLPTAGYAVGQAIRGDVVAEGAASGLIIPYAALLDDGGQPFVFIVKSGVAQRRDVTIGETDGDRIGIGAGLSAGDFVITQGGTAVEDGTKVRTR